MKRFVAFIGIFLIVLVAGYLEPAFFPASNPKKTTLHDERINSHTALPYEELTTSGYAQYVGENIEKFVSDFGEAKEIITTNLPYETLIYGEVNTNYLEVNVQNKRIKAIKTFFDSEAIRPFSMKMTLSDISEQMTIFSNFNFPYNENNYSVELMEEDMNYRPLIAFDNETFATLFFDYASGKIMAIAYMDKETLLTAMPYQLIEGEEINFDLKATLDDSNMKRVNQANRIINLLRLNEKFPVYLTSIESQKIAQDSFMILENNLESIFSSERLASWNDTNNQKASGTTFTLSNDELKKLLKLTQLDEKTSTGMYARPVYDSTMTLLSWFADPLFHSRFSHNSQENIGIAFSDESMVVLLMEQKSNISLTEDSDES